jgi:hypothetical protein
MTLSLVKILVFASIIAAQTIFESIELTVTSGEWVPSIDQASSKVTDSLDRTAFTELQFTISELAEAVTVTQVVTQLVTQVQISTVEGSCAAAVCI